MKRGNCFIYSFWFKLRHPFTSKLIFYWNKKRNAPSCMVKYKGKLRIYKPIDNSAPFSFIFRGKVTVVTPEQYYKLK